MSKLPPPHGISVENNDVSNKHYIQGWGRLHLEQVYSHLRGEKLEDNLEKKTWNTLNRDLNPNIPVIGNLVYFEIDALDSAVAELGKCRRPSSGAELTKEVTFVLYWPAYDGEIRAHVQVGSTEGFFAWIFSHSPYTQKTTFILFLTNILLFIYYHFNIYFNYWRDRGVPYVRPLPFFGNIKDLFFQRTSEALHYSWLYNKLDGHRFGGIYLLTKPVLLVRDPQLARRVLDADVDYFSHKKNLETDQQSNPFCVLDTDVITRKLLRNKLDPIFSLNRIKDTFHVLVNYSASMIKIIETLILYESINITEVTTRFVTDVYGYYALSFDIRSMKDFSSPFHEMSRRLVKSRVSSNFLGFINRYFPKLRFLAMCFIDRIPQNFFLRIFDAVVKLRQTNNIVKEDFLQVLIDLENLKKYSGEAKHSNQDATNPTTNVEASDTWPQKELLESCQGQKPREGAPAAGIWKESLTLKS
ncbi:unnamed protein product [Timema podura]|uniref:Cytochrome P450 n=1 Tax=Timema podura TaxID=61482 RepID=A0ABN7NMH5_TIMPD|nr:unnamed protein product [Timema podura]